MPPGKPFTKVSDAQRKAALDALKKDGLGLLKDLGFAAVDHLHAHPESIITKTLTDVERDTGAVTVVVRGVQAIMREREEKKAAEANVKPSSTPKSPEKKPDIVDAEIVDEEKNEK